MADPRLVASSLLVRARRSVLVGPVSFSVEAGAITALLGPNGSGKTSVLRAVAGLARYEGTATHDGDEVATLEPLVRARRIAYVPQQSALDAAFTVRSVVTLGRYASGGARVDRDDPVVIDAMRRASVSDLADRSFPNLSLGEQRRVLLARALATGATTILLDEPDAYLDVGQRVRLFALLEDLRDQGTTLLVVVHALDEARQHADACVVLDRGSIIGAGRPREVLADSTLRSVFDVSIEERAAPRFVLPLGDG